MAPTADSNAKDELLGLTAKKQKQPLSNKGKSNGKTVPAIATDKCCQKAVDNAVVVIDGMTILECKRSANGREK